MAGKVVAVASCVLYDKDCSELVIFIECPPVSDALVSNSKCHLESKLSRVSVRPARLKPGQILYYYVSVCR